MVETISNRPLRGTWIASIALGISIASGAVASYVAVRTDIATLSGRVNEHELRLNAFDRALSDYHKEQLDYQNEMRASVAHAIDLLTDVRIKLGPAKTRG